MKQLCLLLGILVFISCTTRTESVRQYIDLSGEWQFQTDKENTGIKEQWYLTDLDDTINLPGTMDEDQKGVLNTDTTTMHLNRVYKYRGPAWYRKKVNIPAELAGKYIQLDLERTKPSMVWVDGTLVGSSRLLQSPQQFDVTEYMTPGEHAITIRIDNNRRLTPYGNVHIYSDDTQTNWNGILGDISLEASCQTHITNLQVYPDIAEKKIDIKLEIDNSLALESAVIELQVERMLDGKTVALPSQTITQPLLPIMQLEYELGDECMLWDEYQQPLYRLTLVMTSGKARDARSVDFGMREFSVKGTQFAINGRTTFLRGKHEAAVFPMTGYPPMDVEGWARVYRIAKTYGINHYRFHSYCPPEAAFIAADREGIYLQAELPFWGGMEADSVAQMQRDEGYALMKAYANHPSFVLFSHGNEIWSGHDRVEANINALKAYDSRPLYTMGSNNNIGFVPPRECSDFFVAARTPSDGDTTLTHTRLTHAYVDSRDGGILNTQTPSTETTFDYAVSHMDIPIIGHEIGQYQIYPDFREIEKYTGVLRAWNLVKFRERLERAGMLDQNAAFQKASGAWSALCYKAEMEAAIRTPGFAGFQLLDLQDFPGQGTALVGILDAFMDSKGVVTPKAWRQSCDDVIVLPEFSKFCWTYDEHFKSRVQVANYSAKSMKSDVTWEITDMAGNVIVDGVFTDADMEQGGLSNIGEIDVVLSPLDKAVQLKFNVAIKNTHYGNSYPLWVFPVQPEIPQSPDILVVEKLDNSVLDRLQQGGKVLLFPAPQDVQGKSVDGLFPPDFWNYGMFRGISKSNGKPVSPGTLGILTNPQHPLFNAFPTDFHTNWQWFSIVKASHPLILDETDHSYRPVVQVIDNLERDHKLGLVFEFKVKDGKLLVCMAQLPEITDKPEAAQLYRSILQYMSMDDFNPQEDITLKELKRLLANI